MIGSEKKVQCDLKNSEISFLVDCDFSLFLDIYFFFPNTKSFVSCIFLFLVFYFFSSVYSCSRVRYFFFPIGIEQL